MRLFLSAVAVVGLATPALAVSMGDRPAPERLSLEDTLESADHMPVFSIRAARVMPLAAGIDEPEDEPELVLPTLDGATAAGESHIPVDGSVEPGVSIPAGGLQRIEPGPYGIVRLRSDS